MQTIAVRLVLVATLLVGFTGHAAESKWQRHVLDNGLLLLTQEEHSSPLISHHIFARVGSRFEQPGMTGISHLIEHLRWGGNPGEESFEKRIQALGGETGGHTFRDFTDYVDVVPKDGLEFVVQAGATFLSGLGTKEERFKAERDVVANELLLGENNPYSLAMRHLMAVSFEAHPYRAPTGGWLSDLQQITLQDVKGYFQTYYSPGNVTVLLAGDFNTDNAVALVKKYYGALPHRPEPPPLRSQEPPQNAEKRVRVFAAVDQPAVYVGYHIPGLSDPDIPALQVLDALLSNGRSSRLQRSLVERQRVATSLNPSGYDMVLQWLRDPSLLIYSLGVSHAVDPERAANALIAEIETLRQQTVEDRELRRAVRRLTTDQLSFILYRVWTMWSVSSQTEQGGFYDALTGDPEFVNKLIVAYEKITPTDIQRVARKYLDESNRTIVFLLPRAAEKN